MNAAKEMKTKKKKRTRKNMNMLLNFHPHIRHFAHVCDYENEKKKNIKKAYSLFSFVVTFSVIKPFSSNQFNDFFHPIPVVFKHKPMLVVRPTSPISPGTKVAY